MYSLVGSDSDSASASGSVHAKIKELRTALQKPRGAAGAFGSYTTTASTYATALSITGKGSLKWLQLVSSGALSYCRVKIDGYTVHSGRTAATAGAWYPAADFLFSTDPGVTAGWSQTAHMGLLDLNFKTSLVLEVYGNGGASTTIKWYYESE
jgi:hypothetical protein